MLFSTFFPGGFRSVSSPMMLHAACKITEGLSVRKNRVARRPNFVYESFLHLCKSLWYLICARRIFPLHVFINFFHQPIILQLTPFCLKLDIMLKIFAKFTSLIFALPQNLRGI